MYKGERDPNLSTVNIYGKRKENVIPEGSQREMDTELWTRRPVEVSKAILETWDRMDHSEASFEYSYVGRQVYSFSVI